MAKVWCSAINCKNSGKRKPNLTHHRFPRDKERCAKWVQNTRREDLRRKSPKYLYENCRLCSEHFEASQLLCSGRLVWNAIPTKFDVPNPPPQLQLKRKLPTRRQIDRPEKKAKKLQSDIVKDAFTVVQVDHSYYSSKTKHPSTGHSRSGQMPSQRDDDSASMQEEARRDDISSSMQKEAAPHAVPKGNSATPSTAHLSTQRVKIYRLTAKVKRLQTALNEAKKSLKSVSGKVSGIIKQASKYLSGDSLDFFASQLRIAKCRGKGRRYSNKDKLFALSLYGQSPEAYRFFCKMFAMPSIRSLHSWVEKPGVDKCTFASVKGRVSSEPERTKDLCSNPK